MSLLPEPLLPAPCRRARPSPSSVRIFTNSFALPDPILSFLGRYCTCFSRCTSATSGRVADLWQAGVGLEGEFVASVRPGSALPVATPLHNVHVCVLPVPPSLAAPAAVAFSRLTSAAFGRASLPCFRTGLPPILLNPPLSLSPTELSNGRALLLAAEGKTCTDCVLLCKH